MQIQAPPDRFIVCGSHYKEIRRLVAEYAFDGQEVNTLSQALQVINSCAEQILTTFTFNVLEVCQLDPKFAFPQLIVLS
jgi:hypothetical protein